MLLDKHVKEHFKIPLAAANPDYNSLNHEIALEETKGHVDDDTSHSIELQTPPQRYLCLEPNCNKGFSRVGDLQRHYKTHQTGAKDFDCPATGCARKGPNGFWRSDKLRDHLLYKHGIDQNGVLVATGVVLFPTMKQYLRGFETTPYEKANYLPIDKYLIAISQQKADGKFSQSGRRLIFD